MKKILFLLFFTNHLFASTEMYEYFILKGNDLNDIKKYNEAEKAYIRAKDNAMTNKQKLISSASLCAVYYFQSKFNKALKYCNLILNTNPNHQWAKQMKRKIIHSKQENKNARLALVQHNKLEKAKRRRTAPATGLWCTTKQTVLMMNSISAIEHSADLLIEGGMAMITKKSKKRTDMDDFMNVIKVLNVFSSIITVQKGKRLKLITTLEYQKEGIALFQFYKFYLPSYKYYLYLTEMDKHNIICTQK